MCEELRREKAMEPLLLQTFDTPFIDSSSETYDVQAYAQSRPEDTWQGRLIFTRRGDGKSLATGVETTQPSMEAVQYWATGLEPTYFEGAFDRASVRAEDAVGRPY